MLLVYDIRNDDLLLTAFRAAAQGPNAEWFWSPFGPVGSGDWWDAVSTGKIETHSLAGTIKKYIPAGSEHGQYAEFELADDAGNTTQWQAHGESGETRLFHPGDKLVIKYVTLNVSRDYPGRRELVLYILKDTTAPGNT